MRSVKSLRFKLENQADTKIKEGRCLQYALSEFQDITVHQMTLFIAASGVQQWVQQYANREIPDVQAGFRQGRGTRDQIANIHWIIEKAREFQKNIYFCLSD